MGLKKLKKEIQSTLDQDLKKGIKRGPKRAIDSNLQGWIEALEYVIGEIDWLLIMEKRKLNKKGK